MWSVLGRNLLRAVETGVAAKVEKFLSNGADPNFATFDGVTPLSMSVALGFNSITNILLDSGCSINKAVSDGTEKCGTALHVAARHNRQYAMRAMLKKKPMVDFRDSAGRTACMTAAFLGHTQVVSQLVNAGAEVNMCDSVQRTALHWASLQGHTEVVKLLLSLPQEHTVDAVDWNGETPLVCACREGRQAVVSLLLDFGAPVNVSTKAHKTTDILTEYTPLHCSAYGGYQNIVEQLLLQGADVSKQDGTGRTPLHWATQRGKTNTVELLLQAGSPVNTLNSLGETPLHEAVLSKKSRVVSMLLAHGADPDIKSTGRDSALIKSLCTENISSVRSLLQANCDVNQKGADGKVTPIQIAAAKGNWKLINMLVIADCDLSVVRKWSKPDKIPSRMLGNNAMVGWLTGLAQSPRSLKVLIRMLIRNIFGYSIKDQLGYIELPEALKRFLYMSELDAF